MFEKKTDEKSLLSTESNWDIIIHQEQWHPTGGGVTARANTTINVSPVITSGYYDGDDEYTDHIKDKIETVDPAAKVCHISNIVVRYFNNHSLLLKPV